MLKGANLKGGGAPYWPAATAGTAYQSYPFTIPGLISVLHLILISAIDGLLCVSRLRGSRRLPLVVSRAPGRQPALLRRMGWRRPAPAGVRSSGTRRAWTRSSLKQVSLCVARPEKPRQTRGPLELKTLIPCLTFTAECYVSPSFHTRLLCAVFSLALHLMLRVNCVLFCCLVYHCTRGRPINRVKPIKRWGGGVWLLINLSDLMIKILNKNTECNIFIIF